MLVASAILALLVALIAQIISLCMASLSLTSKKLDSLSESRFVLDRIGADLSARVRQDNSQPRYKKNPGNDGLSFYSQVGGYGGDRGVSIVEYRLNNTGEYGLERGVTSTSWDSNEVFDFSNPPQTTSATDFDEIGADTLRFEISFLTKDGNIVSSPPAELSSIAFVIVTMATIDSKSRTLMTNSQIEKLVSKLKESEDGVDIILSWQLALQDNLSPDDFPQAVSQGIHLTQRYYEIH